MKIIFLLALVCPLLLSACGVPPQNVSASAPVAITASSARLPTDTALAPIMTLTSRPTGTLPPTQTHIPSLTPRPALSSLFHYVFPVRPAAPYSDGVKSHGYPAIDIFAPVGSKFVAVTDGIVEFVSYKDKWDPEKPDPALRSGLAVAIIGDDGLRYYGAHLSAIARGIQPGLRVKAGQLLGYVGATGDARGKESHLHFGISPPTFAEDWKTRRGEIDPYPYLKAWQSGIDLTPELPH